MRRPARRTTAWLRVLLLGLACGDVVIGQEAPDRDPERARPEEPWLLAQFRAGVDGTLTTLDEIGDAVEDFRLFPVPSDAWILDFHPTTFEARAERPFFYRIDNELKYGDHIDTQAPAIHSAERMWNIALAPDNHRAALVANAELWIVSADGALNRCLGPVADHDPDPKPLGERYTRDDDFQWSRDSQTLYVIRDEYYQTERSQLRSDKAELWSYHVPTDSWCLVLAPFKAYHYFFGPAEEVYFEVYDGNGDSTWMCFDGGSAKPAPISEDGALLVEGYFYTYSLSPFFYNNYVATRGVRFLTIEDGPQEVLVHGERVLAATWGTDGKGRYPRLYNPIFLPGERYLLINAGCFNYQGQLLIDTETAESMTLPGHTRVYPLLNTDILPRLPTDPYLSSPGQDLHTWIGWYRKGPDPSR